MHVLDFRVLKALGSPTRLKILSILNSGHMTLSDLSAHFGMHPSSVKEHLEILESADLVKMEDGGRKWKYYSLTQSGAGVINAGEIRIALPALFGFAFLWISARGLSGGVSKAGAFSAGTELAAASSKMAGHPVSDVSYQVVQQPDFFSLLFAAIGLALIFFSVFLWLERRKKRVPG